ncbi:MAG: hypothetical protein Q8Q58_07560 [Candidatus Rokubacteria bacterium]|nr:hypothetical protein [Candidatus Rokubacteria bacterium]
MSRLGRMWREVRGAGTGAEQPWYRRSDLRLMAAAAMVPFGCLLPLCRLTRARATVRRPPRF